MGATNKTTYYELPIFASTDSPKWLVDWPDAMNKIDSAIHQISLQSGTSATDIANLQSSLESLSGTVTSQGSQITSLSGNITALQGTVNTITSLIGNGEPTTTDKTIIGAINELKADIDASESAIEIQRGSLTIGSTSVVLTFATQTIGADTLVDVYTDDYAIAPTDVSISGQVVTLTFDAQAVAVAVAVKVQN